ncbi:DNA polymerase/3'-5' exonuclease PolX, partial [Candidatus Peregrinibacteria bacterium]|nr:DNA polymerase/3'-5' exonuclease PolX [Candidatus Peregrinibacteria bacterium]
DNKSIAKVFDEMADILESGGADFFRVNAYRKAARTVENLAVDLRKMVDENPYDIDKIPGIGKALKDKIIELVQSGKCREHEKMKKGFPKGLLEMLDIRGLGPKKVKLFYAELGIQTLKQLKDAATKGVLRELPGMGEKSESEILKAMEEHSQFSTERHLIHEALQEAQNYINYLKKCSFVKQVEYAGSLRRRQESIGDIDLLVTVKDPGKSHAIVMQHFTNYKEVLNVIAQGDTKSSVILTSGINVDLRVVAEESFGAAMHYFTGSKEHNVHMRSLAIKKALKLNEYGLYKGEKMVAGKSEEDIFKTLDLPYVIPELRKNDGEIEYGLQHKKYPNFVELKDIKGDLHSHSTYSDGKNSIEEMAEAFIKKGYEYFAMTDHSSIMGVTGGMGSADIKRQWKEIDKLNEKLKGKIRILKGSEVDILKDGSLDFEDTILKELDIVVISAHMFNRLGRDEQTKRLIRALENPYVKILGHPTGRLINKRPEMDFDMGKVIDACVQNGVAIEINANPNRLDLVDKYVRIAKDKGALFSIDTDSHSVYNPDFMQFGVGIARRGWLTKSEVINTRTLSGLFDSK